VKMYSDTLELSGNKNHYFLKHTYNNDFGFFVVTKFISLIDNRVLAHFNLFPSKSIILIFYGDSYQTCLGF
jgi:hypothetical protein